MVDAIISNSSSDRKPFVQLTHPFRRKKCNEFKFQMFAMCLSIKERQKLKQLRDEGMDYMKYLKNNKDFLKSVKTFTETLNELIESTLESDFDIDFDSIDNSKCYHVYDKTGTRMYTNNNMKENLEKNFTTLAHIMSKNTSNSAFTKLQKHMQYMWPEHKKLFLSKHKYQKNLPTIKEFSMELNGDEFDDGDDDDDDDNNNNNDDVEAIKLDPFYREEVEIVDDSFFDRMENAIEITKEDTKIKLEGQLDIGTVKDNLLSGQSITVLGARLPGTLRDHVVLMRDKALNWIEDGHRKRTFGDNGMLIFCFDGAQHCRNKSSLGIVTLSCCLYSLLFDSGYSSTSSSHNILTLQQYAGGESSEAIRRSMNGYYNELVQVRKDCLDKKIVKGCTIHTYTVVDYSALYKLKSRVSWGANDSPYWYCKCNKGEGCKKKKHKCVKITSVEEFAAYEASKKKWEEYKKRFSTMSKKKLKKKLREWAGTYNYGVLHWGIHPELLPMDEIRPDVFHMCTGIVKRLMQCLRNMLVNAGGPVKRKFYNRLRTFWEEGHVMMWRLDKSFSSLIGIELQQFSMHAKELADWMLKEKIVSIGRPDFIALCKGLTVWTDIEQFLKIGKIYSHDLYQVKIKEFKKNVDIFYQCGAKSFLKKGKKIGGEETAYIHTLKYYIPDIVDITYLRHRGGVGVFTMQGVSFNFCFIIILICCMH